MENERKKIILLGGEGFIGRNLAEGFADEYECRSIGKRRSSFENRQDSFLEADPYIEKIEESGDVIIHLIDNKASASSFEEEEAGFAKNVRLQKRRHVIIFSSAAIYANPESDYAQRKKMLEDIYRDYCRRHGIAYTAIRLFNVYGRYQMPMKQGSLVANIFWSYVNNKPVEINDCETKRDFIYAGDIARVMKNLINDRLEGTFDLGTGKLTSIGELLKTIEEKVVYDKMEVIDRNIKDTLICPPAKTEILRKMSLRSLEAGLMETFDFYKDNFSVIKKLLLK